MESLVDNMPAPEKQPTGPKQSELNELLNTYPLNEREMLSSHIIAILEKRHEPTRQMILITGSFSFYQLSGADSFSSSISFFLRRQTSFLVSPTKNADSNSLTA